MSEHQDLPRGDEEYYRLATVEFDRGWKDDAIWAKAMALCDGDEQRARYRYIQLRAQQFIEAESRHGESATASTNGQSTPVDSTTHRVTVQDTQGSTAIHGNTGPSGGTSSAHVSRYRFVDPANLTGWLEVLMVLGLVMTLISLWPTYQQYQFLNDIKIGAYTSQARLLADAETHDERQRVVTLTSIGLYIVTAIVFLMWVYRLNANLWAYGLRDLQFTPGWAVGWYFVPVFNLWKPYQSMKEIVAGTGRNAHPVVHWWWFFWILTLFVNSIVFRMVGDVNPSIEQLIVLSGMTIGAEIVNFISILVALKLVHEAVRTQPKPRLPIPWFALIILFGLFILLIGSYLR